MATKKIQIRPKGDGTYSDVLHPETDASVVLYGDSNVETAIENVNTEIASLEGSINTINSDITSLESSLASTNEAVSKKADITGNIASASTLSNYFTVDGQKTNGTGSINHYGVSSTSSSTSTKLVSLNNWTLVTGARITVKFNNAHSGTAISLNVNSTGAKSALKYDGTALTSIKAGSVYTFVYDGSNFIAQGESEVAWWDRYRIGLSGDSSTNNEDNVLTISTTMAKESIEGVHIIDSRETPLVINGVADSMNAIPCGEHHVIRYANNYYIYKTDIRTNVNTTLHAHSASGTRLVFFDKDVSSGELDYSAYYLVPLGSEDATVVGRYGDADTFEITIGEKIISACYSPFGIMYVTPTHLKLIAFNDHSITTIGALPASPVSNYVETYTMAYHDDKVYVRAYSSTFRGALDYVVYGESVNDMYYTNFSVTWTDMTGVNTAPNVSVDPHTGRVFVSDGTNGLYELSSDGTTTLINATHKAYRHNRLFTINNGTVLVLFNTFGNTGKTVFIRLTEKYDPGYLYINTYNNGTLIKTLSLERNTDITDGITYMGSAPTAHYANKSTGTLTSLSVSVKSLGNV